MSDAQFIRLSCYLAIVCAYGAGFGVRVHSKTIMILSILASLLFTMFHNWAVATHSCEDINKRNRSVPK